MNENRNPNAAEAAENTVDSIRKLLVVIGNDDELKRKLEDALSDLTGKSTGRGDAADDGIEPEPKAAKIPPAAEEPENSDEETEEEEDDENDGEFSSGEELSDIFNEDTVAGMVVGFVVGAAAVGGGVLLHKLISRD